VIFFLGLAQTGGIFRELSEKATEAGITLAEIDTDELRMLLSEAGAFL